jgi:hypothetical protein
MGISYLIEHKAVNQSDPIPVRASVRPAAAENGSCDTDAASSGRMADDSNTPWSSPGNQCPVQPVNYVTNRPFTIQGLEIYIVL